jgi:hypothetical protein
VLSAVGYAVWKAVLTGQSIPHLTGGLENLFVPTLPYLAAVCGTLWGLMRGRSHEVQREIEVSGQARPSFPSPPASPEPSAPEQGGGLVSDHAISGETN